MLAAVVLCRVYWIGTDTAYAASAGGQSASLTELPQRRGDFYDRSGRPLTGTVPRWYALCIPGDASYATLFPYVPFAEQAELYERRNSVTPFLIEVDRDLTADGIYTYKGAQRTLPLPFAEHSAGLSQRRRRRGVRFGTGLRGCFVRLRGTAWRSPA